MNRFRHDALTAREVAPVTHPQPKVLLLGLGNDILTDDAIGLHVVRLFAPEYADDDALDVRETMEMGLALLDFIVGYRAVLIVDSIQTGRARAGTVHMVDAAGLKRLAGGTPHFLGVGETLALGRQLSLPMPEEVKILAIEVADPFTLGTELTAPLRTALPHIVPRVRAELDRLIQPALRLDLTAHSPTLPPGSISTVL